MFDPDPTYNTLMAVPVGLGLVMLALLGSRLSQGKGVHRRAWAAAFLALGFILVLLGGHMTVSWPLSGPTAFDNIAFGEPSLAMGVILVTIGFLIGSDRNWRPAPLEPVGGDPVGGEPVGGEPAVPGAVGPAAVSDELTAADWPRLATLLQPLSWFGAVMGLALIAIAFVGPFY